jgi:hypothetical protein
MLRAFRWRWSQGAEKKTLDPFMYMKVLRKPKKAMLFKFNRPPAVPKRCRPVSRAKQSYMNVCIAMLHTMQVTRIMGLKLVLEVTHFFKQNML